MTPETQTALKVIVERAVRPVRATFERKQRMRDELLAHVHEVFDEEVARTGDEAAAVSVTEQRFGDGRDVAGELQCAVSAYDRTVAAFERITLARPEEGSVRRAVRWGMFVFVVMTLVDGPAVLLTQLLTDRLRDVAAVGAVCVALFAGAALLTFEFVLLGSWLRQVLFVAGQRSMLQAMFLVLASIALPGATVFIACLVLTGDVGWSTAFIARAAIVSPVFVAIAFLVARKFDQIRSDCDEWASLSIE